VPCQAMQSSRERRYRRQVWRRRGRRGPAVSEAEVPTAIPVSGADGRGPAAQAYTTSRGVLCMTSEPRRKTIHSGLAIRVVGPVSQVAGFGRDRSGERVG
jgi:hypothetical protein